MPAPAQSKWLLLSSDPTLTTQAQHSFDELAVGITAAPGRSARWGGGFSGRPGLLLDVWETLRVYLHGKSTFRIQQVRSQLRSFWRFLDALEASEPALMKADSVLHVGVIHANRWIHPVESSWVAPGKAEYNTVFLLINLGRLRKGADELFRPAAPRPARKLDDTVVTEDQMIRIVHLLSQQVHQTYARWTTGDALAQAGRSLLEAPRRLGRLGAFDFTPSEADAHATYRELIQVTGHPIPSISMLLEQLGMNTTAPNLPSWWPRFPYGHLRRGEPVALIDLAGALYPNVNDLCAMNLLFMARSAWNPTTVVAIDCRSEDAWAESFSDKEMMLHAYKGRGGSWQYARSKVGHPTHCYQMVLRSHSRSGALRTYLKENPSSFHQTPLALRSPWLGISGHSAGNFYVASNETSWATNKYLQSLLQAYNEDSRNAHRQLPTDILPTDFRDILLRWSYRHSNYSVLITMMLAGHTSQRTTRDYLSNLQATEESDALVTQVLSKAFEQIKVHRRIDMTLIRAEMDGIQLSPEALKRLEVARANRTYSGAGCAAPTSPPLHIDPTHPQDGKTHCRQGHRCTICWKGVAFNDSLPWMARRLAELITIESESGAAKWNESSESDEMEHLRLTLTQWPEREVQAHTDFWLAQIANGQHQPIRFGGQH